MHEIWCDKLKASWSCCSSFFFSFFTKSVSRSICLFCSLIGYDTMSLLCPFGVCLEWMVAPSRGLTMWVATFFLIGSHDCLDILIAVCCLFLKCRPPLFLSLVCLVCYINGKFWLDSCLRWSLKLAAWCCRSLKAWKSQSIFQIFACFLSLFLLWNMRVG